MSIKSNQAGRSMIEMLGVLAIVGVLSAGAIAEFGKAMFRWKAIKCTEEYNLFISEMLVYEKDWIKMMSKQSSGHLYIGPYMEEWGMLPSSWTVSGNRFSDRLGNHIVPFVRNDLMFPASIGVLILILCFHKEREKKRQNFAGWFFIMLLFLTATEFLQSE